VIITRFIITTNLASLCSVCCSPNLQCVVAIQDRITTRRSHCLLWMSLLRRRSRRVRIFCEFTLWSVSQSRCF